MKMKSNHFCIVKSAMFSRLTDGKFANGKTIMETISVWKADLESRGSKCDPTMCFVWDWFNSAMDQCLDEYWVEYNLYPYLNDSHIETVIRSIMNEAEPLTKK